MKRFGGFMKRNAFYFLIVLCIASIAAVIALAVTRPSNTPVDDTPVINQPDPDENKKPDDNPVVKPDEPNPPVKKLTFIAPCNNATVVEEYTLECIEYSEMGYLAAHPAIDYTSSDNASVFASADGTVKEAGFDDLNGGYIVISHDEGYETVYRSLKEMPSLKAGTAVKQGQKLGEMSETQGTEGEKGTHLHFEMTKNGEYVNPLDVMVLDEK